jgi:Helix-turn-helix domain, rpiR family
MGEPFQRERPKKDFPQDYAAHDIIGYLLDNADELSKAHGKIADAILHHPTVFVEKPIEDLVTWLGVSAPTITRFSRCSGRDFDWRTLDAGPRTKSLIKSRRMSGRRAHLREVGWHSRRRPLDPHKVARGPSAARQTVKSLHTRSLRRALALHDDCAG